MRLASDPYKANEKDPLLAKALKSSLWEIQILMTKHYDQRVRDFCKLFRADFLRKTVFFKSEDFINEDPLNQIIADLEQLDEKKTHEQIRRNLLKKHDQLPTEDNSGTLKKSLLGKRKADALDSVPQVRALEQEFAQVPDSKVKISEKFMEFNDFFQLSH